MHEKAHHCDLNPWRDSNPHLHSPALQVDFRMAIIPLYHTGNRLATNIYILVSMGRSISIGRNQYHRRGLFSRIVALRVSSVQ